VTVTKIAAGMYLVEHDGRNEIVYAAGTASDRWICWEGRVFRADFHAPLSNPWRASRASVAQSLTAPMPARVIKLMTHPGATVKKGDPLLVLEAMKMELPVRAIADGAVIAVHCREGDLVQADAPLVDLQ